MTFKKGTENAQIRQIRPLSVQFLNGHLTRQTTLKTRPLKSGILSFRVFLIQIFLDKLQRTACKMETPGMFRITALALPKIKFNKTGSQPVSKPLLGFKTVGERVQTIIIA